MHFNILRKVVASSLLRTLHPLFNVGMIALLFFIIFGILGIQLFAGRFYHCSGDDIDGEVLYSFSSLNVDMYYYQASEIGSSVHWRESVG